MAAYLIALGVALVAAVAVVIAANAVSDDRGQLRTFLSDLRAGLSRRGEHREADAEPVDVDLTDMLEPRPAADDGYLQADELIDLVARARQSLPGRTTHHDTSGTPSA